MTPPKIPPMMAPMREIGMPEGPFGVETAGRVVVAEAGEAEVVV